MIDRSIVLEKWADLAMCHGFPTKPYQHQVDAMALLIAGKNVFLGEAYKFKYTSNEMVFIKKVKILSRKLIHSGI